jgi:hypothetical protein
MKWWFKITMLLMAMVILYVSFVLASLGRVVDDEKFDRLRKIQIAYINFRGEENCYKLPESGVLPTNIFYPIKELRDNLWIYFSRDKIDKLRIVLLIKDKKIEEVLLLQNNGSSEKIINRQMKKIQEVSNRLVVDLEKLNDNKLEDKEIRRRVEIADEFYKFFIEKLYKKEKIKKCYE